MEQNLGDSLDLENGFEDGEFLEWWVTGNPESGGCDNGVCGILEKVARGIMKIDMSVHIVEDSSLSGSWGHHRAKTRGSRVGNSLDKGSNRKAYNKCVQDHLEIREGLAMLQRCIHQQQLENMAMQERQVEKKEQIFQLED